MKTTFFLIFFSVLFLACGETVDEKILFPEPTGYVNDFAGVLQAKTIKAVNVKLKQAAEKGIAEIAVVTVKSLYGYDVSDYTTRLSKRWGVGKKGTDNGVVLLIAPKERKAWIATGYGNEGVLPDVIAQRIFTDDIKPLLAKNNYDAAIIQGVDKLLIYCEK